ncbi:TPA: hypothetical protein N0F65_009118 [Lagenidium giganteum]|uniref:Uncharacterized protein n=1 Tax=Lagenidium giganteum TaxID=4803 RepID=A0AAV2YR15_9STRA|nr:TPA: hypothetical protein N0F65_009118 [Lagenidium giganteum]
MGFLTGRALCVAQQSKHLKLWKIRYFMLTRNELLYTKKSGNRVREGIKLSHDLQVIEDQNHVVHPGNFVIELRYRNDRRIYLSAATEQDRALWVTELRAAQSEAVENDGVSASGSMLMGGSGSSASSGFMRHHSESFLSAITLPITRRHHGRRKRVSKERKEERKRQRLPRMKKSFSEIWLQDMLPLPSKHDSPLVESLCFAGIPKELRGRVWSWVLGNKLQINEDLFKICKTRAQAVQMEMSLKKEVDNSTSLMTETTPTTALESSASDRSSVSSDSVWPLKAASSSSNDLTGVPPVPLRADFLHDAVGVAERLVTPAERSIRLVSIDMPRTFGHHPLFQAGADGTERTTEVLEAYICYRPDLGYVQGMSYLAATLCFHMDSFTAFKALVSLMSTSLLFDVFRMEEKRTFHYIAVYNQVIEYELPRLHAHFENLGIDAQMYAVDWALTLFTRSLPLNIALRLWDCYVYLGTPFFFQAAVGLLLLYEEALLCLDAEDVIRFLHNFPKSISATELFDAIDAVALSCQEINELLAGGTVAAWTPDSAREVEVKYPDAYE